MAQTKKISDLLPSEIVSPEFEPGVKSRILQAIEKEMAETTAVRHNKVTFDKSEEVTQ
jgi:hypothetical protein